MHGDHQRERSDRMVKQLKKAFPALFATKAAGIWTQTPGSETGEWRIIDPAFGTFVSSSYIDLAGLSIEQETVFFDAGMVQQSNLDSLTVAGAGEGIAVIDVMTSIPLNDTDLIASVAPGIGFPGSKINFEHVIFARSNFLRADLDMAQLALVPLRSFQYGSMNATASDRIYCYRIVFVDLAAPAGTLFVSNARHVLIANPTKEAEYEYIMRLKKSYDLQQSNDVDGNRPH